MKISDAMRLPYPVLAPFLTDYQSAEFVSNIVEVKEDLEKSSIELSMETTVTDSNLKSLIEAGHAVAGIFVTGLETYFNEPRKLALGPYRVTFGLGSLKGRVSLRPIIWAEQDISDFWSEDFHPEFAAAKYSPRKGGLLAVGDEVIIHVGREKLAPIESIFALEVMPDFDTRKSLIDLDRDKITIMVDKITYEAVAGLRANDTGRGILMNALYLPAVMEVLAAVAGEAADYMGRRWYDAFISKCEHLGVNLDSPNLLEDGQRLLEYPATFLPAAADKVSS
jgi:hypothetical protein